MTQKNIKMFINEVYSKPPKKELSHKQNRHLSYRRCLEFRYT